MGSVSLARQNAIGVLTIDNPPVNAMSVGIPAGIIARLAESNSDPDLAAIVLRGAGSGTIAGADIRQFGTPWPPGEPNLRDAIAAIEASAKPVIAALAGSTLGGGLELAMGCHYRVASAGCVIGQPEIKLGFPPGAGGTQRLPRLAGAEAALAMILEGLPISAVEALDLGIIDAIMAENLLAGAVSFADRQIASGRPHGRVRDRPVLLNDQMSFEVARRKVRARRGPIQAALACIDCVEAATTVPFEAGLARERALFDECLASDESKALRHVFFAGRTAGKLPGLAKGIVALPIETAAVIGSGTMGAGIAMCLADAGIPVGLFDADASALQRGLATIKRNYDATAAKGRISSADVAKRLGLIRPISELSGIAAADIIVEAVFEDMKVKLDVFAKLDAAAKPGAVLASNTSYLDIDVIAASMPGRVGNVLGMHFFSPANVMRLLEIVRTQTASDQTVMTALALARRMGKQPVISGVCYGFIGNRMLEGYLREAEFLLAEGSTPAAVDKAITDFGFPMGPFAMSDLAGLDIGWRKRRSRAAQRNPALRYSPISDRLCEQGRFGQKTNAGWYRYAEGSRVPQSDPIVAGLIDGTAKDQGFIRRPIPASEIIQRCLLPLVNEGARILEERIALRASDIDTVWINGYAFPSWKGGPMFWADQAGLSTICQTMALFARDHQGWEVAPLLARLAREGGSFSGFDTLASPKG